MSIQIVRVPTGEPFDALMIDDRLLSIIGEKKAVENSGFRVFDTNSLVDLKQNFDAVRLALTGASFELPDQGDTLRLYQLLIFDIVIEGLADLTVFDKPEVVVSEPNLGGVLLVQHVVANHPAYRHVPVILLTEFPFNPDLNARLSRLRDEGLNVFAVQKQKVGKNAEFEQLLVKCKDIIIAETLKRISEVIQNPDFKKDAHIRLVDGIARTYSISNYEMGRLLGIEKDGAAYVGLLRSGGIRMNSIDMRSRVDLLFQIFSSLKTDHSTDEVVRLIRAPADGGSIMDRLLTGDRQAIISIMRELYDQTGGVWR